MEDRHNSPYGRPKQHTICQPFRSLNFAERVANLTESMTGDQCEVVSRGPMWHVVLRRTPEGKMVRA